MRPPTFSRRFTQSNFTLPRQYKKHAYTRKKEPLAGSKTKPKYWPMSSITFADQHIGCRLQMCRAYRKHVVQKSVVVDNFPLFKKCKSILRSKDSLHADIR